VLTSVRLCKVAILVYFVAIATACACLTPVFEAPDEIAHVDYVNFVASHWALPNQNDPAFSVPWEGNQPPLYYLINGVITRLVKADRRINITPVHNPRHVWAGGTATRVPAFQHTTHNVFATPADRFLFYGLRLLCVAMGAGTVFFTLLIGGIFARDSFWSLFPAVVVASLPQFVFSSGTINNDNLANFMANGALYFCFRLLERPADRRGYIMLGVFLGLGLITKKTLLFLAPGTGLVLAWVLYAHRSLRTRVAVNTALVVLLVGSLSGWWFARNGRLYGDVLGTGMEQRMFASMHRQQRLLSPHFLGHYLGDLFPGDTRPVAREALSASTTYLAGVAGIGLCLFLLRGQIKSFRAVFVVFLALAWLVGILNYRCLLSEVFVGIFVENLYQSFIGLFGNVAAVLPDGVYAFYALVIGLACIGLLAAPRPQSRLQPTLSGLTALALVFVVTCLAGVVHFNLSYNQPAGRYLFPVLSLIGCLIMVGLRAVLELVPSRWLRALALSTIVGGFLVSDLLSLLQIYEFFYRGEA
jgi:hypothetical protein